MKPPLRVAVTGAAGHLCYALLFRIINGDMFGRNQPVILQLMDVPPAQKALSGVAMELSDCASPLLQGIICTSDPNKGFKDAQAALMVGSMPLGNSTCRADLLSGNAELFVNEGRSINEHADRNVKVLVVANPVNSCALIAATYAKDIPKENFCALTMLDHNRSIYQLAQKTNAHVDDIKRMIVWGNHADSMFPDLNYATVKGIPARALVSKEWYDKEFIPTVEDRAKSIYMARGYTSVASPSQASIEHMNSWFNGTSDWKSFGVWSTGNKYGVPDGLYFSFPVTCSKGNWNIVEGLEIRRYQRKRLDETAQDLLNERKIIEKILKDVDNSSSRASSTI